MKTHLVATLLIATLAGCVSSGPKISEAQLNEIRNGKTTANDITKMLGRPNFASTNMDGSRTAVYVHAEDENGNSIAPLSGTLTGSLETVTFSFDEKGILTDFKYSPASITRQSAAGAATTAQPAAAGSAQAAPAAGATGGNTAAATASTAAATNTNTKATTGSTSAKTGKDSIPYLWEILRASKSSDPRNP